MKLAIKLTINYYIKVVLKTVLYVFRLFPIRKNRIVFESFSGKQISCNPFYIYEYLKNESQQLELYWIVSSSYNDIPRFRDINKVKIYTFQYFYMLMTCKFYVTNDYVAPYIPFRKEQIVLNTWHGGGAYKRFGLHRGKILSIQERMIKDIANLTTYFLSSSKVFTEIISNSTAIAKERFWEIGMPRNDLFFDKKRMDIAKKQVCKSLNIPISGNYFYILYAPTFRNNPENASFDFHLDIKKLCNSIKKRFNTENVIFMFRGHHAFSKNFITDDDSILDVSSYPLMQELLCLSDMLISDYSSCIWDFSFTFRPCLLFTPDLKDYEYDRNFYIPIKEWGFPIAESNEELCNIIETFDGDKYYKAMEKHHNNLISCESGVSTKTVGDFILSKSE